MACRFKEHYKLIGFISLEGNIRENDHPAARANIKTAAMIMHNTIHRIAWQAFSTGKGRPLVLIKHGDAIVGDTPELAFRIEAQIRHVGAWQIVTAIEISPLVVQELAQAARRRKPVAAVAGDRHIPHLVERQITKGLYFDFLQFFVEIEEFYYILQKGKNHFPSVARSLGRSNGWKFLNRVT